MPATLLPLFVVGCASAQLQCQSLEKLTRSSWEGQVVPDPGIINGAPMRRKLGEWNDTLFIKVEHRTYATQWDGKPIRFSSYA